MNFRVKSEIAEPMKTILACRNPDTLETCMNILFEAGYAYISTDTPKRNHPQQRNTNNPRYNNNRNPQDNSRYNNNRNLQDNSRYNNNRNSQDNRYNHHNDNYFNPRPQINRNNYQPNLIQHRQEIYPHYNQPRQENNFRPQQNFNQQNNNWRRNEFPNPINRQPPPEPMDINNHEVSENFLSMASPEDYPI